MRKNVFGRKFKRDANERKALFKGLISSLILDERIKTTLDKAKAIKGDIDKIVNKAKKGEKEALYFLQPILSTGTIKKMISNIAPRFSDRNSGYTKLVNLGRRFSDNASMVLMEWAASKSQISNLKSQKLESGEEVQKEKTPKIRKKIETKTEKKVTKK